MSTRPLLVITCATLVGILGCRSVATASSGDAGTVARTADSAHSGWNGALGRDGGALDEAVSVFDGTSPAVANLDPELLGALRRAATAAADAGIEIDVNSGWRSAAYQELLLREAVSKYGTLHEAVRWVAPPDESAHVSGDAVDVGGKGATWWLSRHGARYGLCPIYDNEPWHYELRAGAASSGCPRRYADPGHDPRLVSSP
jgi:hypothetical protein